MPACAVRDTAKACTPIGAIPDSASAAPAAPRRAFWRTDLLTASARRAATFAVVTRHRLKVVFRHHVKHSLVRRDALVMAERLRQFAVQRARYLRSGRQLLPNQDRSLLR